MTQDAAPWEPQSWKVRSDVEGEKPCPPQEGLVPYGQCHKAPQTDG